MVLGVVGRRQVQIVGYNPGHDGAFVELQDGRLVASVEAEKDSNYRYTPLGSRELVDAFARLDGPPDVRSEEHTSELQSRGHRVCRLLPEKKKNQQYATTSTKT